MTTWLWGWGLAVNHDLNQVSDLLAVFKLRQDIF